MYFTIDQKLFSFNLIYIESWWMNGFKCIMAKRSKQVEDHKAIKQHSEKRMKMKVLLRIRGCYFAYDDVKEWKEILKQQRRMKTKPRS